MRHPTPRAAVLACAGAALLLGLCAAPACDAAVKPGNPTRGRQLVLQKCRFCHYVEGDGGMIAPPLDKGIALADELVRNYAARAAELSARDPVAYANAEATIAAVLAEKDHARRFELWLDAYLTDTKFDNPLTKMGNVLLTDQQRADVVAWLASKRPSQ